MLDKTVDKKSIETPPHIGPYTVIRTLGRGGMGEVFLVKDPVCDRNVALKRIRPDLKENKTMQSRFLREAKVASVLTHPSIIPILSIQATGSEIYYTMPYIEGETLRQILRKTREEEKNGESIHPIGKSIPSLARIFLQVCEAVAYTHSKGILHRDLKPENIIVGKYGEVMILDWGIADFLDQLKNDQNQDIKLPDTEEDLTRPGKIAGTLAYLPPERLLENSSSSQTDLYALGVILYQLLTLQLPFQRKTIAAFRKSVNKEELIDPVDMAPYRDIPHQLSSVCTKCLAREPEARYKTAEELMQDLKNYIEGRPEWIFLGKLDPDKKEDWQFHEHVLFAKHIAITRSLNMTEWATLMISKKAFSENVRLDVQVEIKKQGQGLGFLFNIPPSGERKGVEEGYCLWVGSEKYPSCKLFRNNVQVTETQETYLKSNRIHHVRIEKIEDHLRFFLNEELIFHFVNHLPFSGKHIGLLYKDSQFSIKNWEIYDGSHTVMINCLAVPNTFLSHKLYDLALAEYQRIGQSFPGRVEGREALFRAGLTLLEKSKREKSEKWAHLALKEFEKLAKTPGAPLEYLGKSLVYDSLGDADEEAKCLELALRKFPKHPLLPILKEHIVYRMHESSLNNREAAYRIILLALRHIPDLLENPDTKMLLDALYTHAELLPFIEPCEETLSSMAIQLGFWLAKVPMLVEMIETLLKKSPVNEILLANALFCLIQLDAEKAASPFFSLSFPRVKAVQNALTPLCKEDLILMPDSWEYRTIVYKIEQTLASSSFELLPELFLLIKKWKLSKKERELFDSLEIWSYLLQHQIKDAAKKFDKINLDLLRQETSFLYFPYGVFLYIQKGVKAAAAHFGGTLDTPYPPTTALPSHFLAGRINDKKGWIEKAFFWEKKELYRQLDLFYQVIKK